MQLIRCVLIITCKRVNPASWFAYITKKNQQEQCTVLHSAFQKMLMYFVYKKNPTLYSLEIFVYAGLYLLYNDSQICTLVVVIHLKQIYSKHHMSIFGNQYNMIVFSAKLSSLNFNMKLLFHQFLMRSVSLLLLLIVPIIKDNR